MAVTHLGHVAIRCSDLEASLAFYAKLGLHEAFRLTRPDGSVGLVYLAVDDHSFLELFPGGTEPSGAGRQRLGYAHACLLVDDIQASYRAFVAAGVPIDAEPKLGGDGNWQVWAYPRCFGPAAGASVPPGKSSRTEWSSTVR